MHTVAHGSCGGPNQLRCPHQTRGRRKRAWLVEQVSKCEWNRYNINSLFESTCFFWDFWFFPIFLQFCRYRFRSCLFMNFVMRQDYSVPSQPVSPSNITFPLTNHSNYWGLYVPIVGFQTQSNSDSSDGQFQLGVGDPQLHRIGVPHYTIAI